jgi:transcriptional regulator of acetoin/glycerol metabolism
MPAPDMSTFADRPVDEVRAAILEGVARLLGSSRPAFLPLSTARQPPPTDRGRNRGRPVVVTAEMVATARRMRDAGEGSVAQIAAELGVSRATLYRHLPGLSQ